MSWLTTPRRVVYSPYTATAVRVMSAVAVPVAVGVWVGALGVTLVPRLGMSTPVASALTLAVAVACCWSSQSIPVGRSCGQLGAMWLASTFLLPLWGDCCTRLLMAAFGTWAATDPGVFLITGLAWGPVVVLAWRMVHSLAVVGTGSVLFCFGLVFGLLSWMLSFETGLALWWHGPIAALAGAVALRWLPLPPTTLTQKTASASSRPLTDTSYQTGSPQFVSHLIAGAGLVACGMIWPALGRMVDQLVPATIHVVIASLLGLFSGVTMGSWLMGRRPGTAIPALLASGALLSAWVGLFAWNAEVAGWASVTLSQTTSLFAVRMVLAAIPGVVVGLAASAWSASLAIRPVSPWLFAAGVVAARGSVPMVPTTALVSLGMVVWGVALMVLVARARGVSWPGLRKSPVRAALSALSLGLILGTPWLTAQYRPDQTARTLFSTTIFDGRRAGLSGEELLVVDEGRLISQFEGVTGTFVAQRLGGSQWQLRRNGLPLGGFSTDVAAFPNFSGDVLLAAIPLALHEQPERVLVSGLTTSVPLSTALAFPLHSTDCVEADAALVRMHREQVAVESGGSPLADDRVRVRIMDPLWAMRAATETYDVILSDPNYPVMALSAADHSAEFYRATANRLARNGIFAQRIRSVDLGPQALTRIIATAQNEFSSVMLFDMAPGETLLVATSSPEGLIREGLAMRLQAGHLRQSLAACGMDWSTLLNLAAWTPDGLMTMLASRRPDPSTEASPQLLFTMPSETYAWTSKQRQLAAMFMPHQSRLALLCGEEGNSPEVVRRLAEVTAQQDLMVKYGDEFWAYRKAVKEQVTHKPRSLMKDKSGKVGDSLHHEDRRRIQYFQALKSALEKKNDEALARLESFERPYDPLLSFFVHAEAAEIAGRLNPRQPARELRHRLHTIYFSPPATRSVRSVVESLRLVAEQPAAEPHPQRRWELQSALLSALAARWATRNEVTPNASPQLLSDLDTSLLLTRRTLDEMERGRSEAGVSESEWTARRRVLNRTLTSRLEQFRQMAKLRTAPTPPTESQPPESSASAMAPPLAN